MIIILYIINQNTFIHISIYPYAVILTGAFVFTLGSHLATLNLKYATTTPSISRLPNLQIVKYIYWLSIIGLPVFILRVLVYESVGPFTNLFQNLRYYRLGEDILGTPLVMYLVTLSYVSLGLQIINGLKTGNKKRIWISIIVSLIYSVFSTGRTFLFLFMTVIIGILLITRKITFKRAVIGFVIFGLVAFATVGIFQHKVISLDDDYEINKDYILENFQIYSSGPIPALDNLLSTKLEPRYGAHTFRSILAAIKRLGYSVNVVPLVQEFTYIPYPINVYTIYQPYYLDFGYLGIISFLFIFGYLHGVIYRKAIAGRSFFIIIYSMLLFPLIMQFFQDQYFSLLSTWVQIIAVMIISYFGKKI